MSGCFHSIIRPRFAPFQFQTRNFKEKPKQNVSEVRDTSTAVKNIGNEPASNKRTRNENPSTMPAFKVRKEKMGDRVTALQQLVSPFGKTDTASVLSEAIEYIKFLHEQVTVPYMKNDQAAIQHQQNPEKSKDPEWANSSMSNPEEPYWSIESEAKPSQWQNP